MYCSTCGVAVAQGLSYCKNCGAKLTQDDSTSNSTAVKPDLLIAAMVTTFLFGLAVIVIMMGVLKSVLALPVGQILAVLLLPFLVMLVLEGIFIRLLLRGKRPEKRREIGPAKQPPTNELDNAQPFALPEGRPSVTEHTTRAFEPVYREPKNK